MPRFSLKRKQATVRLRKHSWRRTRSPRREPNGRLSVSCVTSTPKVTETVRILLGWGLSSCSWNRTRLSDKRGRFSNVMIYILYPIPIYVLEFIVWWRRYKLLGLFIILEHSIMENESRVILNNWLIVKLVDKAVQYFIFAIRSEWTGML